MEANDDATRNKSLGPNTTGGTPMSVDHIIRWLELTDFRLHKVCKNALGRGRIQNLAAFWTSNANGPLSTLPHSPTIPKSFAFGGCCTQPAPPFSFAGVGEGRRSLKGISMHCRPLSPPSPLWRKRDKHGISILQFFKAANARRAHRTLLLALRLISEVLWSFRS